MLQLSPLPTFRAEGLGVFLALRSVGWERTSLYEKAGRPAPSLIGSRSDTHVLSCQTSQLPPPALRTHKQPPSPPHRPPPHPPGARRSSSPALSPALRLGPGGCLHSDSEPASRRQRSKGGGPVQCFLHLECSQTWEEPLPVSSPHPVRREGLSSVHLKRS